MKIRFYRKHRYNLNKPPRVHYPRDQWTPTEHAVSISPFAHLLSSPIRKCVVTNLYLPNSMCLRIARVVHPTSGKKIAVVDNVFGSSVGGFGTWVCMKRSIVYTALKGRLWSHNKYMHGCSIRPDLVEHVHRLLQLKCQECLVDMLTRVHVGEVSMQQVFGEVGDKQVGAVIRWGVPKQDDCAVSVDAYDVLPLEHVDWFREIICPQGECQVGIKVHQATRECIASLWKAHYYLS